VRVCVSPSHPDFGLSKHKLHAHGLSVRDLRGTLPYMAPELASNAGNVSEKVSRGRAREGEGGSREVQEAAGRAAVAQGCRLLRAAMWVAAHGTGTGHRREAWVPRGWCLPPSQVDVYSMGVVMW
jgi:hypothetical protein